MFQWYKKKRLRFAAKGLNLESAEKDVPAWAGDSVHNEVVSSRDTTLCHSFYRAGGEIRLMRKGFKASMVLRGIVK